MDEERRKRLEQRRKFNQARTKADDVHARAEPAFSALTGEGEDFRLYRVGEQPHWTPAWVPRGGRMHWHELDDVHVTPDQLAPQELAQHVIAALRERMRPDERVLIGSQVWFELPLAAFERHVLAIFETLGCDGYIASPPAQWMMQIAGHRAYWKDG